MKGLRSYPARCALAVASGVLYALAYPPLGWRFLVFLGVAGLLGALKGQSGTRARTIGFLHGMAACAVGFSWMFEIFGAFVIALWCVLAVFTALFAEMQSRAALRGIVGWKLAVFTALNWGAWEFIRAELFPLKFPWMTSGLALGPNALLPWIGVYGVGVLVVFAAALGVMWRWYAGLAVLTQFVFLTGSYSWTGPADLQAPKSLKVAGIQLECVSLDAFLTATRQLPADVRHVVWPEYAVPFDIRANKRDWKLVQELCKERDITLTFGTQIQYGDKGWRNIALTIDPSGVRGEHNKVHTVHFFDDGLPGKTALPVETRDGKTGTPVCFDCDYEGITRRMTAAGAESFIVPIMDAEKWTARQHDQHAELFRIRACENGRWMFVCATSGVSQVIDPHGHVHGRLAALKQGTLVGTIERETKLTFYTRIGWLTPWITLVAAVLAWAMVFMKPKPLASEETPARPPVPQ